MRTDRIAKPAAFCALAFFCFSPVFAAEAIKIGAIFGVTGPAAYLGAPEERTARMVVEEMNRSGGILGRRIQLIVKDSGASAEKAISFAKQLIDEEEVVAIIGPTTSGESMAIKDICQKAGMPLISCASAETITTPVAKYVFKVPQKDNYVVEWMYRTMNKTGISKIGVIAANTGFGNGGKAQLEKYAAKYGIAIAISEVYDANATDLSALLTKVNASGVQAVVNWSIEPAQSIVAKNMRQLKMTAQLFQSHGFANIKYVEAAGEAAEGIIFPCGRLIVADQLPDSNPQKKLMVKYNADYKAMYKEDASTFGGHAYDALTILKAAIESAKSTDADKIVKAIEGLKDFYGTAGVFSFSAEDHNGLQMDSIDMMTVRKGKFVFYQ
ncbi:MAG: branched-chain amino acid ABC transporter substrate-binding protein [Treponema sp. GWB1_62_6]|nr:MAG: branched-chain amino acid ABC transporter substrate-binding protein [Treponema sp. GWC1_61_84]OHE71881.1 MAG: branched-chain amino acid ABC transporter substrate-binding protein [Treponema sp. RIFOXYC1_FULL_61_9]OHE72220.1 MAG: branched-chain amino acid ABC transporter substrate-binding protein [Treponema sp. GWB1_62_6]HCM28610.1 branched-chain amino acid ABC transporter substrate-binding protein [Treponema sp.]